MTSKLLEELKMLKKGLASIEFKVDLSTKDIVNRENINERLDKKLALIISLQNKQIIINSGGKIFEVSVITLENCSYNNILKNYSTLTKDRNLAIFLDINPKIFKLFLEVIRQTNNDIFNRGSSVPVKMIVKNIFKDVLEEEVKSFFVEESYEEIMEKFFYFEEKVIITAPIVVVQAAVNYDDRGNNDSYGNAYGEDEQYD